MLYRQILHSAGIGTGHISADAFTITHGPYLWSKFLTNAEILSVEGTHKNAVNQSRLPYSLTMPLYKLAIVVYKDHCLSGIFKVTIGIPSAAQRLHP